MRSTTGQWRSTVFGRVQDHHTRPVLLFDDEHDRAFVFATHPENGGAIYFKSAATSDLHFPPGLGTPFIQNTTDLSINNATATKQNLDGETDLVVLASDQDSRFYVHNFLNLPPTLKQFAPTAGPVGTSVVITGASLLHTTGVEFNGTPASFTVLSRRQVRATVPAGATSGRIRVTTPFGADETDTFFAVGAAAPAQIVEMWPPNHKLVSLDLDDLLGTKVVITSISQDEHLEHGDGGDVPSAGGVGTSVAGIRADRDKDGNGRVYRVTFTSGDSKTGKSGFIHVIVPQKKHDTRSKDDGQFYDACAGGGGR